LALQKRTFQNIDFQNDSYYFRRPTWISPFQDQLRSSKLIFNEDSSNLGPHWNNCLCAKSTLVVMDTGLDGPEQFLQE